MAYWTKELLIKYKTALKNINNINNKKMLSNEEMVKWQSLPDCCQMRSVVIPSKSSKVILTLSLSIPRTIWHIVTEKTVFAWSYFTHSRHQQIYILLHIIYVHLNAQTKKKSMSVN